MGGNAPGTTPTINGFAKTGIAETLVRALTETQNNNAIQDSNAMRRKLGGFIVASVLSEAISNSLKKRRNTRLF
ncbi:MAG: hypothetical protein M3O74_07695 [Pseudomonadota bacterium]|uniref:hypothetical protein n=1 Tax=Burkholderia sp. PAMC 28687 TaxID=1795874 RepID=UPI00155FDA92|nr:hypothetical protein [Burkholderia sp. PAMC 28687]MDP9154117.1 hypothetical protein [Pseudomonadota bacterium]